MEDFRDRGANALSSSSSPSESGLVRLPIECALFTSSTCCFSGLRFCKKGEFSLGVPDPPTNRDTTSLLLPVFGVPLTVEPILFSGESGAWWVPGVAVARDIFVVLCDGVLCSSRSVIAFASADDWRAAGRSPGPFATGVCDLGDDREGDCGSELLALTFPLETARDSAGDALLASSHSTESSF